jgi:hypothetical protein
MKTTQSYALEEGDFSSLYIQGDYCELKIGSDVVHFTLMTSGARIAELLAAHIEDRQRAMAEWVGQDGVLNINIEGDAPCRG